MDFETEPKNISAKREARFSVFAPDSGKSSQNRNHRFAKSFKPLIWHIYSLSSEVSPVQSVFRQFLDLFCSNFQENRLTDFQKCPISLI